MSTRVDHLPTVVDDLVALHSSDPATVYLSAALRLRNGSIDDVADALYTHRSVVRHHAMRRTLWVFTPETARHAHASSTATIVARERTTLAKMLVDNDVTDDPSEWIDDALATARTTLHRLGETTTRELGESEPELRAPLAIAPDKSYGVTVAAHTRLMTLLGFMGEVVRTRPVGTWISGQYRWALAADWLAGGFTGEDPDMAAAAIVDRYLRAFGPATSHDIQWWTGWTKRATTAAVARTGARSVAIEGHCEAWLAPDDDPRSTSDDPVEPWVALLPGLDPTTMGWKRRSWYLDDRHVPLVFDRNGNGGPTIWADGRIVGGWVQRPTGEIATQLLEPITDEHHRLLDVEIDRLTSLIGETRFTVRFPSPLSKRLFAGP